MTKKAYIELAADFKRLRSTSEYSEDSHIGGVDDAIDVVVSALERDNSLFDKQRFLTACGR